MRQGYVALGEDFAGLTLRYLAWGEPDAPRRVVAVHGLTRNAHDFEALATALAARGCHVVCVDVAGRGGSGWLADPRQYVVPVYAVQLARFVQTLGLEGADWIGTSMGGMIGMVLAAGDRPPMRRLVLNDVGPFVPKAALAQVKAYLGLDLRFASLEDLESHLRLIHAGFGPLTDAQWRSLARHSSRETPEGWRLHYDPAIRVPFAEAAAEDIDMWELWDRIGCPTFVLHGAMSPILTADTIAAMRQRGPRATVVTVPGVGHAPALMAPDQIELVARWLEL